MTKNPLSLQVDLDAFLPASEEDKAYMVQMRESSTFFRDGVKRLHKNKVAFISFIVIVFITLASILVPMFWPYSYETQLGVSPGKPVDSSYNNLSPFEYGRTEQAKISSASSTARACRSPSASSRASSCSCSARSSVPSPGTAAAGWT